MGRGGGHWSFGLGSEAMLPLFGLVLLALRFNGHVETWLRTIAVSSIQLLELSWILGWLSDQPRE